MNKGPKDDIELELEEALDEVEELNPERDLSWEHMGSGDGYE